MINENNFQNGDTYSGCEMCGNSEKTIWEDGFGFYCDECKATQMASDHIKTIPALINLRSIETDDKKIKLFNCSNEEIKRVNYCFFVCPHCDDSFDENINISLFFAENQCFYSGKTKTFCREHFLCTNCNAVYIDPSSNEYANDELIIEYKKNYDSEHSLLK